MKRNAEILRLDIVLLGDFNPKIFSPTWFSSYDIIGQTEAQDANVEVIHKDVAIFNLDWFRLQVTRDRFSIFTEQEAYFEKILDLVHHTFTHLTHTPVRALGLNWGGHYMMDSIDEWHQFGHFMAPQQPWENIFKDSAMLRLEITEKNHPTDLASGKVQIRIEPSKPVQPGIFINVNDHYEFEEPKKIVGCSQIISLFDANRKTSQDKFKNAVKNIFTNFDRMKK